MKVLRRSRRLARAGGGAALAPGMAGTVRRPPRPQGTAIVIQSHVVAGWGDNAEGQLGDGTTPGRSTPVQVTGLTGVTQVAASGYFSLALRSDGTVRAWATTGPTSWAAGRRAITRSRPPG